MHYFDNEARLTNMQIIISVGGPCTNKVTEAIWPNDPIKLNCGDDIVINLGFKKAIVYGTYHCRDAVACFIKKGLKNFFRYLL